MASIGHPVVGDTLYGAPAKLRIEFFRRSTKGASSGDLPFGTPLHSEAREGKRSYNVKDRDRYVPTINRNFLHAAMIRFHHPRTGNLLEVRSALPIELGGFLESLTPA